MLWIIILLGMLGSGKMDGNSTTPGPLRKTLHGPTAGTAPSTVEQALTISESAGASHFQKLPGKRKSVLAKKHVIMGPPILSLAAGAYELAGYAHIEFQFPLKTFLKALKEACLKLRNVKIHLQKAEMTELVAATGLWKYRCGKFGHFQNRCNTQPRNNPGPNRRFQQQTRRGGRNAFRGPSRAQYPIEPEQDEDTNDHKDEEQDPWITGNF